MKRIGLSLLILLLSLSLTLGAFAEQLPVWVTDEAGLMAQSEILDLDEKLQALADEYDLNISILTVNTLDGELVGDYADAWFDDAYGADGDGILFLLSMEDRDWYISTNGLGRELLSDDEVYESVDTMLPYLSSGDYYDGFSVWVNGLSYYLDTEDPGYSWDEDWAEDDWQTEEWTWSFSGLWIPLIIGVVLAAVVLLIMCRAMNTKRQQQSARHYLQKDTYHLRTQQDIFLYSQVTKTARPKDHDSGGSGGSFGGHTGSHGGGGGKF